MDCSSKQRPIPLQRLTLVSLHNSTPCSSDFNPIEPVFAKLKVL